MLKSEESTSGEADSAAARADTTHDKASTSHTQSETPPQDGGEGPGKSAGGVQHRVLGFFRNLPTMPGDIVGSLDSALSVFDPVFNRVDHVAEKPLHKGTPQEVKEESTDPTRNIDRAIRGMGKGLDSALGKVPLPHVGGRSDKAQEDQANLEDHIAAVEKKLEAKHYKVPRDVISRFLICYGLERQMALDASIAWCIWRNEFGVDEIDTKDPDIRKLLHSGAFVWRGNDHEGRPILYIEGTGVNPDASESSPEMRGLIVLLEAALGNPAYEKEAKTLGIRNDTGGDILGSESSKDPATFTLVYDYSQFVQPTAPGRLRRRPLVVSIKLITAFYNILLRYYPGRLAMILVCPSNEETRRQWLEMVEDLSDVCGEANTKLLFPDPSEMRAFVPRKWLPAHLGGQSPEVLQPDGVPSTISTMLEEAEERAAKMDTPSPEDDVFQNPTSPAGVIESQQILVGQDQPEETKAEPKASAQQGSPGMAGSELETPKKESSSASGRPSLEKVVRPKREKEPLGKVEDTGDRVEDL